MLISTLRAQHVELMSLARALSKCVQATGDEPRGVAVRASLDRLAGALLAHLELEDSRLYPELFQSPDAEVARVAHLFWDQVGDLSSAFVAFNDAWRQAESIDANPAGFRAAWAGIAVALSERILQEENLLYVHSARAQTRSKSA